MLASKKNPSEEDVKEKLEQAKQLFEKAERLYVSANKERKDAKNLLLGIRALFLPVIGVAVTGVVITATAIMQGGVDIPNNLGSKFTVTLALTGTVAIDELLLTAAQMNDQATALEKRADKLYNEAVELVNEAKEEERSLHPKYDA